MLSFLFLLLVTPSLGQTSATDYDQKFTSKTEVIDSSTPTVMHGYIFQTMTTPESYVLTNSDELKEFVATLPPYIPYKILPAPVNKDPFLHGFSVDFDQEIIAVAVGRDRISDNPSFLEADYSDDGWREIYFSLTAKTSVPYPYGWAVYSAIVLPRSESPTRVKMITIPAAPAPKPHKNSHPNRSFLDRAKKF